MTGIITRGLDRLASFLLGSPEEKLLKNIGYNYENNLNGIEINLEIEVSENKIENQDLYYTDDSAEFTFRIKNNSDESVNITIEPGIQYSTGISNYWSISTHSIEPEETGERSVVIDAFSFEGSAVIGVSRLDTPGIDSSSGEEMIKIAPSKSDVVPVGTFSIQDRTVYELSHNIPRRVQVINILLTAGIVAFAIVQLIAIIFG